MGTEVASRPPLHPGNLAVRSGTPSLGRNNRRERNLSVSSFTSTGSSQRIYSREYQLRIQARKHGLSSAFVCIGAKIHHRFHTPDPR